MTPAHTEPSVPEIPSQVEMMTHSTDDETEAQRGREASPLRPHSPHA